MLHEVSQPPKEPCPFCEAEAAGLVKRDRTIFLEVKSENGIAQTGRYLKLSEAVYNALATQFSVPNRD